jgi:hypothetical protein
VSWDDEPGGILSVSNNIDESLILFAGSINNQNIIGGIRNLGSRYFDIFDNVPAGVGSFLLRAVKETNYRAKGSNLAEDDIIFAHIVTYDTRSPREVRINIQKSLGGEAQIYANNDSDMVLEIRLNSPTGQAITTLAPWERNKLIYLDPNSRGYQFFPVFQYYDRKAMGIRTVAANGLNDSIMMAPVVPGSGRSIPLLPFEFNSRDLFSPFATLIVRNELRGAIYFSQGTNPLTSQSGMEMINPGTEIFELDLNNQKSLVMGGFNIDVGRGASNYIKIPDFKYEAGVNYELRVKSDGSIEQISAVGSADLSDLKIALVNER